MRESNETVKCDICDKKEVKPHGSYFFDWIHVQREVNPARPAVLELGLPQWDVCSAACLAKLGERLQGNRKKEEPVTLGTRIKKLFPIGKKKTEPAYEKGKAPDSQASH